MILAIGERFRTIWREFVWDPPSEEMQALTGAIRRGSRSDISVHGLGHQAIVDYYGGDGKNIQRARLRLPWGSAKKIEKSYYITLDPSGRVTVRCEGFFPFDGH